MRFLLFLAFAITFALPLVAQDTLQPNGKIAVADTAETDAAIAVRIREILGELDTYDDVTVTVSKGIVVLRGKTLDAADAARLGDLVARVEGVVAVENDVVESTDVVERLDPAMKRFQDRLRRVVAYLPLLAVALAAFVLVTALGFLLARLRQPWDRFAPNAFIADIYRQILRLAFIVAGVVVALDILNATALLSTILGAAGIIGLAIGFAVRDTVENFIASIMLSIRQPFRPNDTVMIDGDIGKVIRLTSRATILLSFDGNHIRIPNSTVFKSKITNYSRNDTRRFTFDFDVPLTVDLHRARDISLAAISALPFVRTTPEPLVWITEIGDTSVRLSASGWINQHEAHFDLSRGEAIRAVKQALVATDPLGESAAVSKIEAQPDATHSDVQSAADQELERIAEAERSQVENEDLLSKAAPEE